MTPSGQDIYGDLYEKLFGTTVLNPTKYPLWESVYEKDNSMKNIYLHEEGIVPYERLKLIPDVVRPYAMCGWIVGGGARYILGIDTDPPKDWDILVPWSEWYYVRGMVPVGAVTGHNAGLKFTVDEILLNVWPDDLGIFLRQLEGKSEGCPCLDIQSRLVVGAYRGMRKGEDGPHS